MAILRIELIFSVMGRALRDNGLSRKAAFAHPAEGMFHNGSCKFPAGSIGSPR